MRKVLHIAIVFTLSFLGSKEFINAQTPTILNSVKVSSNLPSHLGSSTSSETNDTSRTNRPIDSSSHRALATTSVTYTYTGSVQTFTVPNCVTSITIQMAGAQGGAARESRRQGTGGLGAAVNATLAVVSGEVLNIYVGGQGSPAPNSFTGGTGGYGGNNDENGGNGYGSANTKYSGFFGPNPGYGAGGGGGGASTIRVSTATAFGNDLLSAAGGGGAGEDGSSYNGFCNCYPGENGGYGGGVLSSPSAGSSTFNVSEAGGAGTAGAEGSQGNWGCGSQIAATAGTNGNGGNAGMTDASTGACFSDGGGGGGGGGYYGGGGGCGGGGGGGYSYIAGAGVSAATVTANSNGGNGFVIITYTVPLSGTTISGTNPITCAGATGSATCTAAGGSGSYSFSWSPTGGTVTTLLNTSTYSNLTAGTYTCIVTDLVSGCSVTETVTITPPTACNDNWASAELLSVQTGCAAPTFTAGTNKGSTLEANEYTDCQDIEGFTDGGVGKIGTVWYKFTVTAATGSGPFFVNMNDNTGSNANNGAGSYREYYHGMALWGQVTNTPSSTLCPTCECNSIQCMDNEDVGYVNWDMQGFCTTNNIQTTQPAFTKYSMAVSNLPNGTYYIQVGYPVTNGEGTTDAFSLCVTTCLPAGYTLTNPLSLTGQGQIDAGATCLPLGAGKGCSSAAECALTSSYIDLTTGSSVCSSGGNINSCTSCPSGNDNTSSSCIPCITAVVANGSGLAVSSSSATYPAGFYPGPTSKPGTATITYQTLATDFCSTFGVSPSYNLSGGPLGANSGVVGPGYSVQFCYSFTTNSSATSTVQLENDFPGVFATGEGGFTPGCLGTPGGNVYWADFALYDSIMGTLLECGTASSFSLTGIGCSTTYILCFMQQNLYDYYQAANQTYSYAFYPYVGDDVCNPTTGLCTTPLPIDLLTFQAEYEQATNQVTIYWSTASQTNNALFTVEKSVDGKTWQKVTTVPGAGTTTTTMYYDATDENPFAGISYYRLMQTDYDGHNGFSKIATIDVPADYYVNLFPNPTTGNMTLRYSTTSQNPVNVRITDISGKVMANYIVNQVQPGTNDYLVMTSTLEPGMYIMQVTNAQKTYYLKFIKQ